VLVLDQNVDSDLNLVQYLDSVAKTLKESQRQTAALVLNRVCFNVERHHKSDHITGVSFSVRFCSGL